MREAMTDRERINRYRRLRMARIQAEPPPWRFIDWIIWRLGSRDLTMSCKRPTNAKSGDGIKLPRYSQENATGAEFGANWGIRKEIP